MSIENGRSQVPIFVKRGTHENGRKIAKGDSFAIFFIYCLALLVLCVANKAILAMNGAKGVDSRTTRGPRSLCGNQQRRLTQSIVKKSKQLKSSWCVLKFKLEHTLYYRQA